MITDVVTNRNGGGFVEVTKDWYAQDNDGNVWYLGEDTKEYENGKVASTKGSWEHGVNGAYGGIIMPADPQPGHDLSPGVLQGRGRGSREGGRSGREGDGSVRDLRERSPDRGLEPVGARCR